MVLRWKKLDRNKTLVLILTLIKYQNLESDSIRYRSKSIFILDSKMEPILEFRLSDKSHFII